MVNTKILASSFKNTKLKSTENVSICVVTKDNKRFAINLASSSPVREDNCIPNSLILTENPIDSFKVICRISTDEDFSKSIFKKRCKIITNSLEDKLKSFAIIEELISCI